MGHVLPKRLEITHCPYRRKSVKTATASSPLSLSLSFFRFINSARRMNEPVLKKKNRSPKGGLTNWHIHAARESQEKKITSTPIDQNRARVATHLVEQIETFLSSFSSVKKILLTKMLKRMHRGIQLFYIYIYLFDFFTCRVGWFLWGSQLRLGSWHLFIWQRTSV